MTHPFTIIFHDTDTSTTHELHVESEQLTQREVWMHILNASTHQTSPLQLDEVDTAKEELGDDIMDLNLTAVLPGHVACIYHTLKD